MCAFSIVPLLSERCGARHLHLRVFGAAKDIGSYLDTDLAGFENAMQRIMTEAGWGSTDYGQALSDMKVNHWSLIDRELQSLFWAMDGPTMVIQAGPV